MNHMVELLSREEWLLSILLQQPNKYPNRIYDFIDTIPSLPLRKTKHPKYGKYYARYLVKNKRTQYYITLTSNLHIKQDKLE